MSDQVHELATSPVPLGLLVEFEGMSWSPTPLTAADEMPIDFESECILPISVSCTEPVSVISTEIVEFEFLPCLLLTPPLLSVYLHLHSPVLSPLAASLVIIGSPWSEYSPAQPMMIDPVAPPRTSMTNTPPRPVEQSAQSVSPFSLGSIWDRRPFGFTGLPRPSSYALVSCRSACTADFWSFTCTSSLHPFLSVGLCLPSGSNLVLSHSASISVLRRSGFTSVARSCSSFYPQRPSSSPGLYSSMAPPESPLTAPSQLDFSLGPAAKPIPWLLPPSSPP
ncbi:hypothetical protein DPX16_21324 [Anabarilius grahami]|uniref:Uncharacterized protein n=1 Tax=Anabarilius grahami TaxID=495550 RepID=A0A3N0XEJ8_ANAGA|nr:hypothetical protein DPX16_21324 [Anabarilius grahami]